MVTVRLLHRLTSHGQLSIFPSTMNQRFEAGFRSKASSDSVMQPGGGHGKGAALLLRIPLRTINPSIKDDQIRYHGNQSKYLHECPEICLTWSYQGCCIVEKPQPSIIRPKMTRVRGIAVIIVSRATLHLRRFLSDSVIQSMPSMLTPLIALPFKKKKEEKLISRVRQVCPYRGWLSF